MSAFVLMLLVKLFLPFSMKESKGTAQATSKDLVDFTGSLAYEQVVLFRGEIITKAKFAFDTLRKTIEDASGYHFAFLGRELADLVLIRRYKSLEEAIVKPDRAFSRLSKEQQTLLIRQDRLSRFTKSNIERFADGFWTALTIDEQIICITSGDYSFPLDKLEKGEFGVRPTLAIPTSRGLTAVWLFDRKEREYVVRPFLKGFTTFMFRTREQGGMSSKLFKRPSALFVRSYFSLEGTIGGPKSNADFTATIQPSRGIHHDGVVIANQRVKKMLVDDLIARAEQVSNPVRKEKMLAIAAEAAKAVTWHSFRGMTPWGMFKGDIVFSFVRLPGGVDFLVFDDNLKTELSSVESDRFIMTAAPKKQVKRLRTNRQVFSLLRFFTYGGDKAPLVDAFGRQLNTMAAGLRSGEYLPPIHADGDAVSTTEDKTRAWVAAGLPLKHARYLVKMLADNRVRQLTPEDRVADKKRRFPVPNGIASSMHTPWTYELVYGRKCPVKDGHVMLDRHLGWIPGRDITELFYAIAGGADSDDVIDGMVGFADGPDTFFRIKEGQAIGAFGRNPLSASIDTLGRVGKEFQVWPIQGLEIRTDDDGNQAIIMPWGTAITTVIEVSTRPFSVAELDEVVSSFTPTPLDMPDEVSYGWIMEKIRDNRRDPLGRFMNTLMAYEAMGWTWTQVAAGEDVVDACQQLRNPDDFVELDAIIGTLREAFVGRVIDEGKPVDRYILKSAGCLQAIEKSAPHLVGKGMFTDLVDSHKAEVEKFSTSVEGLYDEITTKFRGWYRPEPTSMTYGRTRAYGRAVEPGEWLSLTIGKIANNAGLGEEKYLTQSQRELLGDHIADQLVSDHGKAAILPLVKSMFLWAHRQDETNAKGERLLYPERHLFWGGMFLLLLEALGGNPPESPAIQYPELPSSEGGSYVGGDEDLPADWGWDDEEDEDLDYED